MMLSGEREHVEATETQFISFQDAQRDASLLDPVSLPISSTAITSSKGGANAMPTNGESKPKVETEQNQQQQRARKEIWKVHKEEKEEIKKERRAERERAERQDSISQAITMKRSVDYRRRRLIKEGDHCEKWTAGRKGNEALGRQLLGLWQSSRPSEAQLAARRALVEDAEAVLQKRWPGCNLKLVPFGSSRTGLMEATSDIDLTLMDPMRPFGVGTPEDGVTTLPEEARFAVLANSAATHGIKGLPDYYSVQLVASALRDFGEKKFYRVFPVNAKVPIVKFVHGPSKLSSDININDSLGIANSDMLQAYFDLDVPLVRPFVYALKKWASRRGINDPSGKSGMQSFNSYTICLIAIQYLQVEKIIPCLQSPELLASLKLPSKYIWQKPNLSRSQASASKPVNLSAKGFEIDLTTGARRFDVAFASQYEVCKSQKTSDGRHWPVSRRMSIVEKHNKLGELVHGFFVWLSEFNFEECGFSVRLGQPFRKRVQADGISALALLPYLEPPSPLWDVTEPIMCQDPFILDRNTSGAIKKSTLEVIIDECSRARALLEEDRKEESRLLSDLLIDWEYEEKARDLDVLMDKFDEATRLEVKRQSAATGRRNGPFVNR